jgi:hypothetical protein
MSSDDESDVFVSEAFESDDDDFESESDGSIAGKKRKTPPKTKNNKSTVSPAAKKPAASKPATVSKPAAKATSKASKKIVEDSSEDEVMKSKPASKPQVKATTSLSLSSSSAAATSLPLSAPIVISKASVDVSRGPDITTDAEAKRVILAYFKQQNRPYSAIQVYDNLHKRAAKSVIERALTNLCETNAGLLCKEYGKAKIYFVDQNIFPAAPSGDIDDEIEALETSLNAESDREKRLKATLTALESEPNDENFDR